MASYNINQNAITEIQILGRLHGQRTRNVFHYRYTGTTPLDGPTTIDALLEEFQVEILEGIRGLLSNEWMCEALSGQLVAPVRYRVRFKVINQAGAVQQGSLPSTTCVVMRRTAILSGRKYQGRVYIPGIPTGSEQDSVLHPNVLVPWTDASISLKEPLSGGTAVEPFVPNLRRTAPASALEDVELTGLDTVLRIQRRREVGVGE